MLSLPSSPAALAYALSFKLSCGHLEWGQEPAGAGGHRRAHVQAHTDAHEHSRAHTGARRRTQAHTAAYRHTQTCARRHSLTHTGAPEGMSARAQDKAGQIGADARTGERPAGLTPPPPLLLCPV